MNRGKAKLLTVAGVFCCLCGLMLSIYDIAGTDFFYFSPVLLLVGGIVLIVLSLAYYTEK